MFRRAYGILGLSNTWAFVTWASWDPDRPALFVRVPDASLEARLDASEPNVVLHDVAANRFTLGGPELRAEVAARLQSGASLEIFQPGRFDPTFGGSQN